MIERTYSWARRHLAAVFAHAENTREPVVVTRRGRAPMAVLPAAELGALRAAAYGLPPTADAARLATALARSERGEGTPVTIDELRRQFGLTDRPPADPPGGG